VTTPTTEPELVAVVVTSTLPSSSTILPSSRWHAIPSPRSGHAHMTIGLARSLQRAVTQPTRPSAIAVKLKGGAMPSRSAATIRVLRRMPRPRPFVFFWGVSLPKIPRNSGQKGPVSDVLEECRRHPETKSAEPDSKSGIWQLVGLLQRLQVTPVSTTHVGKEPNEKTLPRDHPVLVRGGVNTV